MKLKDLDSKNKSKRFRKTNWKIGLFIQWKTPHDPNDPVGFWVYHTDGQTLTEKGFFDDVDNDNYQSLLNSDGWVEL